MNPIQLIANFLNNILAQVSFAAWPIALILTALVGYRGFKVQHETGSFPIWPTLFSLVGIFVLWFIIANPRTIGCWILGLMGEACPSA